MTKIDFYVLSDTTPAARWLFACRLIDKAYRLGHRVLVALDNQADAQAFDELLWTFKPESFIPHHVIGSGKTAPVEITYTTDTGEHNNVLLNLSRSVPVYFSRFERLGEVVIQEPEVLQVTREHFHFYKERGYPIETRKL